MHNSKLPLRKWEVIAQVMEWTEASPEMIAEVVLRAKPKEDWEYKKNQTRGK